MKTANWTISTFIILVNVYFLPFSFSIMKSSGFGLFISLPINLLLITAGLTFNSKYYKNKGILILNTLGLLWAFFWLWLLLTVPKMC